MKVENITLQAICNYGSAFQTLATQHVFEGLGCQVETVDYVRQSAKGERIGDILANGETSAATKLKQILLLPSSIRQRKVFDEFLRKYVHLSRRRYTRDEDFTAHLPEADVYCTGSDQVWNTSWHSGIPYPFFLTFAPDEKKKIAFSASFGKEKLDEAEQAQIRPLLQRYSAISVRERSGLEILNDMGIQGTWVLDPTLTVTPDFWNKIAVPRMIREDYILVYQLGRSKAFNKYVRQYAKLRGMKLVRVCMRYDHVLLPGKPVAIPSPEEVLSLFRHASCVITDSFHATAFSIGFHRPFVCIYPKRFSTRLESILTLTGLTHRVVTDPTDFSIGEQPIHYEQVDRILAAEREKTMAFLKNALYGECNG